MTAQTRIPRRRQRNVDAAHPVYELDLWLVDSEPVIWRSLAVPAEMTLEDLHWTIQAVMPWDNEHLHHFQTRSGSLFEPAQQGGAVDAMWTWLGDGRRGRDESGVALREVFDELKQALAYEYDFGDSWTHGLKLIATHAEAAAFTQLPWCLAGARAAPPEDCGGVWGYQEKLEILRQPNPDDDWHQDVLEWMGEFDPEAFDLAAVNRRLASVWHPQPSRTWAPGRQDGRHRAYKRRKRKSR